jgi:acid phosphatase/tartrate-resistant acid phosphatase type 5
LAARRTLRDDARQERGGIRGDAAALHRRLPPGLTRHAAALGWLVAAALSLVCAWLYLAEPGPAVLAPDASDAPALTFLAVGRQGYDNRVVGRVARAMEQAAAARPVHAVWYLGDNFYPEGVRSSDDPLWRRAFEQRYDGPHLRGTPFYPVPGNHDHLGTIQAEIDYARERRGSGRWRMEGLRYSRDFGRAQGRVLVRAVFLDTVTAQGDLRPTTDFLREAFGRPGDPLWRVVVAHNPSRSLTATDYKQRRVLSALLPLLRDLRVDLYVSGDDWFQQILDRPGEPLHVSTNGGTDKLETVPPPREAGEQARAVAGFGLISFDARAMEVDLRNARGEPTLRAKRQRAAASSQSPAG